MAGLTERRGPDPKDRFWTLAAADVSLPRPVAERFARLVEGAQGHVARLGADIRIGIAPHSLRAVDGDGLAAAQALAGDGPIDMHLAEQTAEVDEVLATTGRRPVEWLLENLADQRWCLIHATR